MLEFQTNIQAEMKQEVIDVLYSLIKCLEQTEGNVLVMSKEYGTIKCKTEMKPKENG